MLSMLSFTTSILSMEQALDIAAIRAVGDKYVAELQHGLGFSISGNQNLE